jgi:superoxide dismutase, Cu-Zn family
LIRRGLIAATLLLSVFLVTTGALAQVPAVGANAEVRDAANRLVATAEFREGRGEVLITILFPSPPVLSGTHGVHIHEVGRCDPPDFLSAGNIFNPFNKQHGRQNPQGAEVGDLPNVNFAAGLTSYNTTAPGATLGQGQASLLGPNRTALIITSGEDDQQSQPDGNSGSRIACGVINPAAGAPVAAAPAGGASAPTPTPTRPAVAVAPAAPKVASPVPAQPAAKPANSPVVVRPPAVSNPALSPSPAGAPQGVPTPIVPPPTAVPAAAAPPQSANSGLGSPTALIIAVLGVGLVGAGYLLRRRSTLQ